MIILRARSVRVCAGNAVTECMGNLGSSIRNSPSDLRARSVCVQGMP